MDFRIIDSAINRSLLFMNSEDTSDYERKEMNKILNLTFKTKKFLDAIEKDLVDIMKDKVIDLRDLPFIVSIVMKSTDILKETLKASAYLKKDCERKKVLKYIVYAVLQYTLLANNCDEDGAGLIYVYNSIWTLLEMSIPVITDRLKEKTICCC